MEEERREILLLPYPNQLFLKWLMEWEEDARRKDLKIRYSLRKAINALKGYGQPLKNGNECKILAGIGEMTAKRLDDKLIDYEKNHIIITDKNGRMEENIKNVNLQTISISDIEQKKKKNKINDENEKDDQKRKKPYVPIYRSGPYAILLTLLLKSQEEYYSGYTTKREIVKNAQPFCDCSMETLGTGKFHTGWSAMKMLIERGLINRQGGSVNSKFNLTESGKQLAEKILIVAKEKGDVKENELEYGKNSNKYTILVDPLQVGKIIPIRYEANPMDDFSNLTCTDVEDEENQTHDTFFYEYLDENDKPTLQKEFASIVFKDDIYFKIRFSGLQRQHTLTNLLHIQTNLLDKDNCIFALMPEIQSSSIAPGLNGLHERKHSYFSSTQETIQMSMNQELDYWSDKVTKSKASMTRIISCLQSKFAFTFTNHIISADFNKLMNDHFLQWDPLAQARSESIVFSRYDEPFLQNNLSQNYQTNSLERDEQDIIKNQEKYIYKMPTGSFDIILVLDNREIRQKNDRNYIQLKLFEQGVQCCSRSMELGDVVWIAKSRLPGAEEDEILLDYIIERKRMDDLAASIKDGRFAEQKFRLKQCGLKNVIYVIEEYSNEISLDPQALQSAIIYTQVIDEFYVKRTDSLEDTITYLVAFTNYLRQEYHNKDLYVLRERTFGLYNNHIKTTLSRISTLLHSQNSFLVSYPLFQDLNTKSKSLTLHDLFIKQLLQIRGISPAKSHSIVQHYPTLRSLSDTYENTPELLKEKLLSNLSYGPHQRLLGPSLSKKIFHLFCQFIYD